MNSIIYRFLQKNKWLILILYFPIYMSWFLWLEHRENVSYFMIRCIVDDHIPFCELFIVPYLLWFAYVAAALVFLFLQKQRGAFYRTSAILMLGMTTFLLLCTVFPNAQPLRPETFPRDNILTSLVAQLYESDTPTNVCPSIHVYNSVSVHVGLSHSKYFREHKGLRLASLILCTLICLSTMFLKQHSFVDVVSALILYAFFFAIIYRPEHA